MAKKDFLEIIPNRAGVDMGSDLLFVHVSGQKVRNFKTHTSGLQSAIQYLKSFKIESVAVEATGVYWINFFDMCHESDLEVWVVNPKYTKTRAGKKTDVQDAIWIQQLHSADLLEKSFMPLPDMRTLREYVRTRENYISEKARKVNQMNKALIQMNIRLDNVPSQIHGASGMRMIKAILAGQRNADALIQMCHTSIKKNKSEELRHALQGNYQSQYLFALEMALTDYEYLITQIHKCDKNIQIQLEKLTVGMQKPETLNKAKPIRHNKPAIEGFQEIMQTLTGGVDITTVPGITNYSLLRLVSELGINVEAWPTKKHFTSFLNLSPKQHQSGKYNRKAKSVKSSHRAGQIFRELAQTVMNSKKYSLGVFGRKIKSRKGPQIGIKALARKLAEMYYICIKRKEEYIERGVDLYNETQRKRSIARLCHQASKLGYELNKTKSSAIPI